MHFKYSDIYRYYPEHLQRLNDAAEMRRQRTASHDDFATEQDIINTRISHMAMEQVNGPNPRPRSPNPIKPHHPRKVWFGPKDVAL